MTASRDRRGTTRGDLMYAPASRGVGTPTRVAILGCGYWGMNYVRVLSELPDSEVVLRVRPADEPPRRGGAPLPAAAADDRRRRGPRADRTSTPWSSARRPRPTATSRAARCAAGKHVLVEKPLTLNVDGRRRARSTSLPRSDRVLLTGHTFLYNEGDQARPGRSSRTGRSARSTTCTRRGRTWGRSARTSTRSGTWLRTTSRSSTTCWTTCPSRVTAVGARVLGNGLEDVGFITLRYAGG